MVKEDIVCKSDLEKWALKYADNGIAVFPLQARNKKPITKNGLKDATTDKQKICNWWKRYPNANIGIATGHISNLLVIDLDERPEKNKSGHEALFEWEKENGKLPETCNVLTSRGGEHLYFRTSQKTSNSTDLFDNGVDVRGDGGYVVAPPSIHEKGHVYEWEDDFEDISFAEANNLVFKFISDGKNKGHVLDWNAVIGDNSDQKTFVESGITATSGNRNNICFQKACDCFKIGMNWNTTFTALRVFNNEQCKPPLNENELVRTIKSAQKTIIERSAPVNLDDLNLSSINEAEELEAEWLVPEYIPKGQITCLVGDGGVGKSTIWAAICAAASDGRQPFLIEAFGDVIPTSEKKIIIFSGEDSVSHTIKRRLRKNGANQKNIFYMDIADERFKDLKVNSDLMKGIIEKYEPDLVVLDPIQAFLKDKTNISDRSAMRNALVPLIGYGSKFDTTFIIVVHTNKRDGVSGRKRMADSSDMWDLSRSVLVVGKTEDDGINYISQEKSNYGPLSKTVLFSLGNEIVKYEGITEKKDSDYVTSISFNQKQAPAREDAKKFILENLKNGEMKNSDLQNMAEDEGITKATFRRAKEDLIKEEWISVEKRAVGKGNGVQCVLKLEKPASWVV